MLIHVPSSQPVAHQSLRDVPSGGQRFEMPTVVDQLHLLQVQSLQNLLAGPVHHLQLLVAVHQDQGATVDPLRGRGRPSGTGTRTGTRTTKTTSSHDIQEATNTTIRLQPCAYTQTDDVTAEVKLSLLDDMDGAILLLLYLHVFTGTSQIE